jgi:chorismate dehydratase
VPEVVRNLLGVPEASYIQPLLYGLRNPSADLELLVDIPSRLALRLQQRIDSVRCAFLSPIDYARHGGDYLVVPGVGVSSSSRTDTVQLFINPNVQNVETIAVDIRVTSEIILAKIILAEKFPNLAASKGSLQFVPMLPKRDEMLRKADAALVVNFFPYAQTADEPFALDLVEEWNDLTGLPYVHGVWVGHDEPGAEAFVETLLLAKEHGLLHLAEMAEVISTEHKVTREFGIQYLSGFSYGLGEEEQQGFAEFVRYAFYHGILPDVPDLNFFEGSAPPTLSVN